MSRLGLSISDKEAPANFVREGDALRIAGLALSDGFLIHPIRT